jgi:putative nucleotidyltransferase with HDIG domain
MKHGPISDINALTSGVLGLLGISLLLIPTHFHNVLDGMPGWMVTLLGVLCFILGLLCQIMFAFPARRLFGTFVQISSVLLLLIFGGFFFLGGTIAEGILLILMGFMHVLPITPLWNIKFLEREVLTATAVISNLACGIFLIALENIPENSYNILYPYHIPLGVLFILTAALGSYSLYGQSKESNNWMSRSTALPWLIWSGLFLSERFSATLIPPILFTAILFFMDIFPWSSLRLPENDTLGKRVVMVGSSVELITLLFVFTLLTLSDRTGTATNQVLSIREAAFIFYVIISIVMYYGVATILMTITGLMTELNVQDDSLPGHGLDSKSTTWNERLARYLKPFALTQDGIRARMNAQADQINLLTRQVSTEKRRNAQLTLLAELSQQLENQLDSPVAAQLTVNTLERAINCSLACVYTHEADHHEFMLLAAAGQLLNLIPPGYRQNASEGIIGRAIRQRKTQIVNDIRVDPDYVLFDNEPNLSAIAAPLLHNGHVNGMIVLANEKPNAFGSTDVALVEAVAAELTRAWERSGYHRRLMDLIQAGSTLSSMVEPDDTAREISSTAMLILQARFTYVQIQLGQEGDFLQSASAGEAPRLLASLMDKKGADPLVQAAYHASQPFRVRDVRKYISASHLEIDNSGLRSMLAIPIRWHTLSIGAILAFGKQNEVFFTENDESLAELLSIQAAGAFESAWLQQELRSSLRTTSLLYRLSNQIIQAEELKSAALDIAQTAFKLAKGSATGIVLLTATGEIEAEVEVDASGAHTSFNHPMDTIQQAMNSGQMIYLSQGHSVTRVCLPIQTPIRKYGALWMNIPEDQGHKPTNPADLQTLVNQAAIALERSLLLVESRRQAREIKAAYDKLEATYDQTLAALMSALDARDRETEGHSIRVSHLAGKLGKAMGLSYQELKALERGSLLHDIGKIGVSDTILHKPASLTEKEWHIMRLHPDIGARIVEGIPFLQDTIPVIRYHQERWDGSGYPVGLFGENIPLLARLFAVVDAFDALTSNRPYRQKISAEEALTYLQEQAGKMFDPHVVIIFEQLVLQGQAAELLASG